VIRPTTVQVTNCRFGVTKWVKAYSTKRTALTDALCKSYINVIHCSKVQLPLPGRCVNAATLVLNHGATNSAPTPKYQPLLSSKRRPHFRIYKRSWNEQIFGHGPRNQERLCWRRPAAIYWTWT
jgi:hypothetical protein